MGYYEFFKPSKPREAKGGIKAQGKSTKSWWAKRWMDTLDSYGLGARLSRGRSYARHGQVLSIDIAKGSVSAKVQGSRARPYAVTMKVKTLDAGEWESVQGALKSQAVFAAKLLAGEMPDEIETVFTSAHLSLFPRSMNDLSTDCSCPDWSNPCKHTAAVYILLGEEFDRDPFLLFTLRGITRDELLKELAGASGSVDSATESDMRPPEPLPTDPAAFWNGGPLPPPLADFARIPPVRAANLKRLGAFPFWRGNTSLLESLEPVYRAAALHGLELAAGEGSAAAEDSAAPTLRLRLVRD